MHYDIAAKRLMEIGGEEILRRIASLEVRTLDALEELPQEQVWLTCNDFCARCTLADGTKIIVLLEFQTRWRKKKLLDMLVYAAQRMRRHNLPVVQIMVLFQPSAAATARFSQGGITFEIHLVKIWELEAKTFLDPRQPGLWPLAALAKDGLASAPKIDKLLHKSKLPQRERSDLLTIFAIFLGMRDKGTAQHFIQKRRELMIESPIYDLIKDEGREEGRAEGLVEGQKKGQLEMLRITILEVLKNRFRVKVPVAVGRKLERVATLQQLQRCSQLAWQCQSMREFNQGIENV